MRFTERVADALLGVTFVLLGVDAVLEPGDRVEMATGIGVPRPRDAVRVNGLVMVAGGLALCAGLRPRTAAAGLALSMVPTTLAGHAYWRHDEPALRKRHRIQFLKNVGMVGGLLAVVGRPLPAAPVT